MLTLKQVAVLLSLIFLGINTAYASVENGRITLASPGLNLRSKATLIGPLNPKESISFTVWLKLRNKAQFDQLSHDIYDPSSPRYRHFLTYDQFQSQYAPSMETKRAVQQYFIANGMSAKVFYNTVLVTGTVKQVEQVFNVKINNYRYQNKIVYASETAPTMVASLAHYVSAITGLTNIPRFHPMAISTQTAGTGVKLKKPAHVELIKLGWDSFIPAAAPTTTSLSLFSAAELQTAYNFAGIAPIKGSKIDGTGQTIVLIDGYSANSPSQIMADANSFGGNGATLPLLSSSNFKTVDQNGNPCTTQCTAISTTGWEQEQALDLQAAHTLAPGANIVMVLTSMTGISGLDNALQNTINSILTNYFTFAGFSNAYVISNSWDALETAGESLESTLQTAMTNSLSVNFSSGDCGDNISGTSPTCNFTASASVNYPASSTYATAVGGTSLFVDANWNYAFETGWGYHSATSEEFHSGSTGGISQFYGPAAWQSTISNFIAGGYSGTVGSNNNMRAVPDIAMLADNHTGLQIIVDGSPLAAGGTSLACPLFSAVTTLVNQARALRAGGTANPIGQVAPMLYNNQSTLAYNKAINLIIPPHQIISGAIQPTQAGAPLSAFIINYNNNLITFSWDSSLTIVENQFWNDVVGLGSPHVPNFVAEMATL